VANRIKVCGIELLDLLIQQLGCPTLLPYSHDLKRVVVSALQTSVSTTLRAVLDPTSSATAIIPIQQMFESGQGGRKKRKLQQQQQQEQQRAESAGTQRWLHSSIAVRCAAVKLFRTTVLAFGIDYASPLQGEQRPHLLGGGPATDISRGISMVAGCLVEQLAGSGRLDDWGSAEERLRLLMLSTQALSDCLFSGGEFLSISTRTLIDSIASTCLAALVDERQSGLPLTADAKVTFLSLGSACVSTPWPDGASCPPTVVNLLRQAAQFSCDSGDSCSDLSASARATLTLCDHVLSTSRIPALVVVTRSSSSNNNDAVAARQRRLDIMSADDLLGRMQRAMPQRQEADSGPTEDPVLLKERTQVPQKSGSSMTVAQEGGKTEDSVEIVKSPVDETKSETLDGEEQITLPPHSVDHSEEAFEKTDVPADTSHEKADEQKITVTNSALATNHLQVPTTPKDDDVGGGKGRDPEMELRPWDGMHDRKQEADNGGIEDDDVDDDLPMIVDCEPDAGDEDSD